ncbi:MAG TPA: ABC transporter ATP-binding protein [Bacillota bacterium]|nr:ABC transporter ATP-binding protein [Bacillota bacterium]HOA15401.1 ABC transporter ATP-binding protein [Bacillota bacterium]HOG53624.1 ABC transporter ATP-binding protein [Bacillota bacterium]
MASAIEVNGLVKDYGKLRAVDDISFDVEQGKLFAFLGPNGAGKSTTINIICTILAATSGSVKVFGHRVGAEDEEVRSEIGVVFQGTVLDDLLSVRENLAVRGSFYGWGPNEVGRRIAYVAAATGLNDYLDRPFGKLSGGQKRRADIARALMNTPKVLFLDEPTTGLDPQTRAKIWDTIGNMKKDGTTVFLTTNYMEEAAIADDVAIIDHGKIVARGTPDELRLKFSKDRLRIMPADVAAVSGWLKEKGHAYEARNDVIELKVKDSLEALQILKALEGHIRGFEVIKGDMDDVFLAVTGRKIRGEEEKL